MAVRKEDAEDYLFRFGLFLRFGTGMVSVTVVAGRRLTVSGETKRPVLASR